MSAARRPPLFTGWEGRPLAAALELARELLADTTYPTVERWRERGGKVLGHFQVYFPEEIAHAAGMLPFKVRGAPLEPRRADSRFGSYLCSILRTSLELALDRRVELDLFVAPPICDAARNLAAVWGRNVAYPTRVLCLPQHPDSDYALGFLCGEYERLRREIEAVAGREVTAADLRAAIVVFNRNRALLRRLYALKRERPWLLPVEEWWVLCALGGILPRGEHNRFLAAVLPLVEARPARPLDRLRVVFVGGFCEQPPLDLLALVSRSCYVVEDDLLVGLRFLEQPVPEVGEPLMALAGAYLQGAGWSPVQHDPRKPKEQMLRAQIQRSGAAAAILTAAKMCEPGLEDQVALAAALEADGVPYFLSEFEENMTSFDHLELQLETFVENLLFDDAARA